MMRKKSALQIILSVLVLFIVFPVFGQENTTTDAASQKLERLFNKVKKEDNVMIFFDFIRDYSDSIYLSKMDSVLSDYIIRRGMIWEIEQQLEVNLVNSLPLTMSTLYKIYSASGMWRDLDRFKEKYPSFLINTTIKSDIEHANIGSFILEKDSFNEEELIQYIKQSAPKQTAIWALQKLIVPQIKQNNWEEILSSIEELVPFFDDDPINIQELKKIVGVSLIESYPKKNLGTLLNSEQEEYAALLSTSGNQLFFCRQVNNRERIFYAQKEGTNWNKATEVEELYYGGDRAPLSLSADGLNMILFENGKIHQSQRGEDGWSKPISIDSTINQSEWQGGATISTDGNVFIFCSRRTERVGVDNPENTDLYISFKDEMGEWSTPKNMGISINTNYSERSPFLHPDGKTLYFSTNGRGGLGGLDVYKTTKQGDNWLNWTIPMNLGKTTNTTEDDWGYTVSANGKYALFSSIHPERGDQDLFTQKLDVANQPEAISTISGQLTDTNNQPLEAKIIVEDSETGALISEYKSDPKTGAYIIILPDNRIYSYTIIKEGFFYKQGQLDLKSATTANQIIENIKLDRLIDMAQSSLTLPIENLSFESGKAKIQAKSYTGLNHLADLVKNNDLHILLEGHTDDIGAAEDNQRLSEQRAISVKQYLIVKGCDSKSIETKGFGESSPKIKGTTIKARNINRRVEIRIIPK